MSVNAVGVYGNIMEASVGIVLFISATCETATCNKGSIFDLISIYCVNNFFRASLPSFATV